MNYWHIELYSKEIIKVKPDKDNIEYIQKMIRDQKGAITTPTRSIVVKDIKDFRLSDEVYSEHKRLESNGQAPTTPQLNKDGSIKSRYVKKGVPRRRWDNYYRFNASYRFLREEGNFVIIVFKLPIHQINHDRVQELSLEEEMNLSKAI